MSAGQRELELAVVDGRAGPRVRGVAQRAILRKARGRMTRVLRTVKVREVARRAGG